MLGLAVAAGVLHYFRYGQGNALFLWAIGGLILSQLAEYVFQIWLFRRGV